MNDIIFPVLALRGSVIKKVAFGSTELREAGMKGVDLKKVKKRIRKIFDQNSQGFKIQPLEQFFQ